MVRSEPALAAPAGSPVRLDPGAAIDLADAALTSGREAEALPAVLAAAERHRNHAGLWQFAGLLHRNLDQHGAAIRAFDRAATLARHEPLIAHSQARVHLEAGLPATALFERALRLAPSNEEVLLGTLAAMCAEGRATQAIEQLDRLLARHPAWLPGHELSARLRWEHGQRADFTASVERAVAAAPLDPKLWRTLLILLIHADRFEQALDVARRARAQIGDHIVVLANEAAAWSELGRTEEADALYERIGDHPDPTLAVRHIRHLLRASRISEAAAGAEPLVAGDTANLVWPYLSLAWRVLGDPRWHWLEGDERLVGVYDIADELPPLNMLAACLRRLHKSVHQPLDQSLRGGTQTDGNLFQRIEPEIVRARAAIADAVREHVTRLPPLDPRHPLLRHRRDRAPRFSGSWSVRLSGAGHHANHNHPVGWLSSALYVTLPERVPGDGEHASWLTLGVPQAELNLDLPPVRLIEPKPGRLVLFPSTMWHGTLPFTAGERMTIAFDVAAPGLPS